jgi:hypothetical protein
MISFNELTKIVKSLEAKNEMVVVMGWRWGNGELFIGIKSQLHRTEICCTTCVIVNCTVLYT